MMATSTQYRVYPALEDRQALPPFFVPAFFMLIVVSFLLPNKVRTRLILPVLLNLYLVRPFYAADSLPEDYQLSSALTILLLLYIDLTVIAPAAGEEIRYTGDGSASALAEHDCSTAYAKLKWALRLMTTPRGIGWNWRVKNVPEAPAKEASMSRGGFVIARLRSGIRKWALKLGCVYICGAAGAYRSSSSPIRFLANTVMVGSGVGWAVIGLNYVNDMAAALTVLIGLCEPWEWPPMTGRLEDAWSVRQTWSVAYHQLIKRICQHPPLILARTFGLKKGSLPSRCLQLFGAFFIISLIHEYNTYNSIRSFGTEFRFFMLQPVVIICEDIVQHFWRQYSGRSRTDDLLMSEKLAGWIWTFLWFSWCLVSYIENLVSIGLWTQSDASERWLFGAGKALIESYQA